MDMITSRECCVLECKNKKNRGDYIEVKKIS